MDIQSYKLHKVVKGLPKKIVNSFFTQDKIYGVILEVFAEDYSGVGYVFTYEVNHQNIMASLIEGYMDQLIGKPVEDLKQHWQRIYSGMYNIGRAGISVRSLCAVDTALWDLFAQKAKLPLYKMLGSYRDEVQVYASAGWMDLSDEELIREAENYAAQGYTAYKFKVGNDDIDRHIRRSRALRKEMGQDFILLADANQAFTLKQAERMAWEFAGLGIDWLEEPVNAFDMELNKRLRESSPVRIVSGESLYLTAGFRPFINNRALDVAMPDLALCGGPTEFMRVAEMADAAGIPVSAHYFTEVSCHLMAACRNYEMLEHVEGWWDAFFAQFPKVKNGKIKLGEEPGLGIKLDYDALKHYAMGR